VSLEEKIKTANDRIVKYWFKQWHRQWRMCLCHSGGKDSCVILDLVDKAVPYDLIPVIHNPKDSTDPLTVKFLYELSKRRELRFVPFEKMNIFLPNWFEIQVDGSRKGEAGRTERSNLVIFNGKEVSRDSMGEFTKNGKFGIATVFPIYDWTDGEVWQYIKEKGVQISDEYRTTVHNSSTACG
jgi:3'-phosphoadenosine 5'-phosphosulfate sulfotransferase (PAPS reductase)/FAD synthetase